MFLRTLSLACVVCVAVAVCPTPAHAQTDVPVSGRLINSLTGAPIVNATIVIEELKREAKSNADGQFTLGAIPAGTYHVSVHADGFSSRRTEITVVAGMTALSVPVDPELHDSEVVSVSPDARSQFESFQPTSVLSGQELSKQLEMSLGATLESQ